MPGADSRRAPDRARAGSPALGKLAGARDQLVQYEGYARESQALKQFLSRQNKARVGRRKRLKQKIYKEDNLKSLYTESENARRRRRPQSARPAWNQSTLQESKAQKARKRIASQRKAKRRVYSLAEQMDQITLNNVEVGDGFRPEIKAALAGFKARLNSRIQHPTAQRLLAEMAEQDPEEVKRKELNIASNPHATMPQYAKDAEHQWLYRIKLARKQREEKELAMTLRAPNEFAKFQKQQERQRKRAGRRGMPVWNASVAMPGKKQNGLKNTVLAPDDNYSHKPQTHRRPPPQGKQQPLDAAALAQEVAAIVRDEEEEEQMNGYRRSSAAKKKARGSANVPGEIKRGSYWGAFLQDNEDEDDHDAKPMYPVVPPDIPRLVHALVKEAEEIEDAEENRALMFRDDDQDHTFIDGAKETEWIKGTYFGYKKKMAEVHSADPVEEEVKAPLRRSYRESFVPKDALGNEIKQGKEDFHSFSLMGRTWKARKEDNENLIEDRRRELATPGLGLAEAGKSAVKTQFSLNVRQQGAESEFSARMELARVQRQLETGQPVESEHHHHHHKHVAGAYMDATEESMARQSQFFDHRQARLETHAAF